MRADHTVLRDFFSSPEREGVVSVYVFGSAAAGRAHRESDLDVAVLLDRSRFPRRRDRSEERVTLIADLLPFLGRNDLDLVVLNDIPSRFARAIVTRGRRIACRDPEADVELRRDAQLLAADLDVFLRRFEPLKLNALRR